MPSARALLQPGLGFGCLSTSGCAHSGWRGGIEHLLLPGGWTDIKADVQRCLWPGEERSLLYSFAAPLAAL